MHQECWLAVTKWLNSGIEVKGKPSPIITGIVDAVVKREHCGQTRNTWDCTMEAAKMMSMDYQTVSVRPVTSDAD